MRIGFFADILRNKTTGIERHVYNIIEQLLEIDKDNEYILIHTKDTKIQLSRHIETFILENRFKFPGGKIFNLCLSSREKFRRNFDLLHCPFHEVPFLFNPPVKTVVTVHDITACLFPRYHPLRRTIDYKILFKPVLRRVNRIIAISENTRKDLIEHFKLPEDKIDIIPPGCDTIFRTITDQSQIMRIKEKYSLPDKFILSVSTLEPRKNFVGIIRAYSIFKKKRDNVPKLVIVGGKGWGYNPIFSEVKKLKLEKHIIFTGYVPDEDLPFIYNASSLFVFASFYEGFGLPPLEAMACGIPTLCTSDTSFFEATGNAAVSINPYDVEDIAEKIERVLNSKSLREDLIQKGLRQAGKFNWKETAQKTLEVYRKL